jgi:FkbM family methyltransferase
MSLVSSVRHSVLGIAFRQFIHLAFYLQHRRGAPISYRLPRNIELQLYPVGEVAEFLRYGKLFERNELKLVSAYLQPGMKVMDVGANIGLYSILSERLVRPNGKVWAFEPSEETYQRLAKTLELNKAVCVYPVRLALSDRPDEHGALGSDRGFGDAYRYLVPEAAAKPIARSRYEEVRVTTLDKYASTHNIGTIDFLKIDIEGGEYRALLGARDVLQESRDVVVMFENEADWCERAGCRQLDSLQFLRGLGVGLYVWSQRNRNWTTNERDILRSGIVWASRNADRLPAGPA